LHYVYSVAGNGSVNLGSLSQIDVTGDTLTNVIDGGLSPVHAAITPDGSRLYVANSGDDTITVSSSSAGVQPATIDLVQLCPVANPCPLVPVFVHSTESARMYVADKGTGTISVITTGSNAVIATVAVNPAFAGSPLPSPNPNAQPVALAEMPNGTKIYSVNQGDGTVTSIYSLDDSVAARITGFSPAPVWAVASSDNNYVYVLGENTSDFSGAISVISTLSDTVVSSVPLPAGTGANFIFYDKLSNRLYVTNKNAASVSIFNVSGGTLTLSGTIPIKAAAGSGCTSALQPTSVTVLGDDSRAYVASYQADPSGLVCAQADVINNGTGMITTTIPLYQATDNSSQTGCASTRFRVSIAASGGGTNTPFKVFVAQCDAGTIADIYTFSQSTGSNPHPADVLMAGLPAPVTSSFSAQVTITAATQSGGATTYTYSPSSTSLQVGTMVVVTGMADVPNDGVFVISGVGSGTFTVNNPNGVQATSQSGNGTAVSLGNPIFLVAGP
jgi:YVTN family beta-propeller protein